MLFIREAQRNEERGVNQESKIKRHAFCDCCPCVFAEHNIVFILQHQFSNEDAQFTT